MAKFSGTPSNDVLRGTPDDDVFIGRGGNDRIIGRAGDDRARYNYSTDGSDRANLGAGADVVSVTSDSDAEVRLTFTSSEVGNGDAYDSDTLANQDGGLAVRMRLEDGSGGQTGPRSRYDDEGITFIAGDGLTFDVRDLVSGIQRGNDFEVVSLGTALGDNLGPIDADRAHYINGGRGRDDISGGDARDFLVGGRGGDTLAGQNGGDTLLGGLGRDFLSGGKGNDTAIVNLSTDGGDRTDLGGGSDVVNVSANTPGQVRLTFTSPEVGNGNATDSDTMANQDGGFAVRMQLEDGSDGLTGPRGRYDDEGTTFVAGDGLTFDVRDLVSGTQRGDAFKVVTLGTQRGNDLSAQQPNSPYYFNAGAGDDKVVGGSARDFLVGGVGDDVLAGLSGNDSFIGGAGNDVARGGDGRDTAIYGSNFEDAKIKATDNGLIIKSADGRDKYVDVERIQFAERTVTIDDFMV